MNLREEIHQEIKMQYLSQDNQNYVADSAYLTSEIMQIIERKLKELLK